MCFRGNSEARKGHGRLLIRALCGSLADQERGCSCHRWWGFHEADGPGLLIASGWLSRPVPRHPGRRGDRRAGLAFGQARVEGRVDQRSDEVRADAVLVGAAGGPEEAGVALALVGGEDELDEALAVVPGG